VDVTPIIKIRRIINLRLRVIQTYYLAFRGAYFYLKKAFVGKPNLRPLGRESFA